MRFFSGSTPRARTWKIGFHRRAVVIHELPQVPFAVMPDRTLGDAESIGFSAPAGARPLTIRRGSNGVFGTLDIPAERCVLNAIKLKCDDVALCSCAPISVIALNAILPRDRRRFRVRRAAE